MMITSLELYRAQHRVTDTLVMYLSKFLFPHHTWKIDY